MMDSSEILFSNAPHSSNECEWLCDSSIAHLYRITREKEVLVRKDLREELLSDDRYRQIWRKEYAIGHEISSPFVVRYHDIEDTPDTCSLYIDYIEGDTLQDLQLKPSAILRVVRQILDGLTELHTHGVLHLDLKPSNIMLTRLNHDVRIIDLGGCYSSRFPYSPAVTDHFAAPEALDQKLTASASADLYSTGRIIEYLLKHSDKSDLSRTDRKAEKLLKQAAIKSTQTDPSKRFPSAQDMKQALTMSNAYFWPKLGLVLCLCSLFIWWIVPHPSDKSFIFVDTQYSIISDHQVILAGFNAVDSTKHDYSVLHQVTHNNCDYQVKAIGEKAFENNHSIRTLSIASTVDSIAPYAFLWCDHLSSAFLPKELSHLGEGAFSNCVNLSTIRLPQNLTHIPCSCFHHTGFTSFTIPEGVTTIGQDAFVDCSQLQHITLPSTLHTIERGAFYLCPELTDIELPASLRFLGEYAFLECPNLHTVRIHALQPPFTTKAFNPEQGITLMVPSASLELYKQDSEWGQLNVIPLQQQ